ncbi:MAG: hypothetical protein QM692_21605 [Thermomicrobiales bacterium]
MVKSPKRYATLQQLVDAGLVRLPLEIRGKRQGHEFRAEIVAADGTTTWREYTCASISAAAGEALASISGYPRGQYPSDNGWPPVNGWQFWDFEDANGVWEPLHTLRERYDAR